MPALESRHSSSQKDRGLQLIQDVQDLLTSKQFQPKVKKTLSCKNTNISRKNSQVDKLATPFNFNSAARNRQTPSSRRSRRSGPDSRPSTHGKNPPSSKITECVPSRSALASQAYKGATGQSSNVKPEVCACVPAEEGNKVAASAAPTRQLSPVPTRQLSPSRGCMPHGAALASQAYEEAKLQSSNVESEDRGQPRSRSPLAAPNNYVPCHGGGGDGGRKMRKCCPTQCCPPSNQACCAPCAPGVVKIPAPTQICNNTCKSPCCKPKCPNICNMAYVQPPVPESFKPARVWCPPTLPIAWDTVYRMSYPAQPFSGRRVSTRPQNNLEVAGCFSYETTQAHDYQGCPGEPARKIYPCTSLQVGQGNMSELTTFRHDYVPKMVSRQDPIIPVAELLLSDLPMEGDTIMTMSYRPPPCIERPDSYKPILTYKQPSVPFVGDTIQKLSYVPQPICPKEDFPWAHKIPYKCPEVEVESKTIYNSSYRPPGRYIPCGPCNPCNDCCNGGQQECCKASCFDPCCPGVC